MTSERCIYKHYNPHNINSITFNIDHAKYFGITPEELKENIRYRAATGYITDVPDVDKRLFVSAFVTNIDGIFNSFNLSPAVSSSAIFLSELKHKVIFFKPKLIA